MAVSKWEYRSEILFGSSYKDINSGAIISLDELGTQGWELIGVVNSNNEIRGYFKRERGGYLRSTGANLNLPTINKIPKRIKE